MMRGIWIIVDRKEFIEAFFISREKWAIPPSMSSAIIQNGIGYLDCVVMMKVSQNQNYPLRTWKSAGIQEAGCYQEGWKKVTGSQSWNGNVPLAMNSGPAQD